jgi:hypothetical protein
MQKPLPGKSPPGLRHLPKWLVVNITCFRAACGSLAQQSTSLGFYLLPSLNDDVNVEVINVTADFRFTVALLPNYP